MQTSRSSASYRLGARRRQTLTNALSNASKHAPLNSRSFLLNVYHSVYVTPSIILRTEARDSYETSVNFYRTTRRRLTADSIVVRTSLLLDTDVIVLVYSRPELLTGRIRFAVFDSEIGEM